MEKKMFWLKCRAKPPAACFTKIRAGVWQSQSASIIPVKPMAEGFTEWKDHIQFLFYLNLFLVIFNGCHEEKKARHFGNWNACIFECFISQNALCVFTLCNIPCQGDLYIIRQLPSPPLYDWSMYNKSPSMWNPIVCLQQQPNFNWSAFEPNLLVFFCYIVSVVLGLGNPWGSE